MLESPFGSFVKFKRTVVLLSSLGVVQVFPEGGEDLSEVPFTSATQSRSTDEASFVSCVCRNRTSATRDFVLLSLVLLVNAWLEQRMLAESS